jgi:hypothetical protein
MSNDTDFTLALSCPDRKKLEYVLQYVQFKKRRWDFWQRREGRSRELLNRVGGHNAAAVVAWGLNSDSDITVDEDGCASISCTAWANQNSLGNVWISGDDGELVDLVKRFAFLDISGEMKDEYGNQNSISLSGSDYEADE